MMKHVMKPMILCWNDSFGHSSESSSRTSCSSGSSGVVRPIWEDAFWSFVERLDLKLEIDWVSLPVSSSCVPFMF